MLLRCFPRIHIGLMDMGNATPRRYGGAGFTLSAPAIEIFASSTSKRTTFSGLDQIDADGKAQLLAALEEWSKSNDQNVSIRIRTVPTQHVGLGTKTSLLLGSLTAATLVSGLKINRLEIQKMSRRGGASGVGINSFFRGGFIADGGHPANYDAGFSPSSQQTPEDVPHVISRVEIPKGWEFHLLLAPGKRFSGNSEQEFFTKNTPIPRQEVLESIALLYHGVVPAVATTDLDLLKRSLIEMHRLGFKRREIDGQSENVRDVVNSFVSIQDCAVGLSSMGPVVYAISNRSIRDEIRRLSKKCKFTLLATCKGRNKGFEVESYAESPARRS
jgi:beta-ribofuranosylaminobenzene 5'-phosphate synthase